MKLRIIYSMANMTTCFYLTNVIDSKTHYGTILDDGSVKWEKKDHAIYTKPILELPDDCEIVDMRNTHTDSESKLQQITEDKKQHIENLNIIIHKLLEK
jgi:hypothetical protein